MDYQVTKMTWRNHEWILPTERSWSENTKTDDSNCVHFWKRQSYGDRKCIYGWQVSRRGGISVRLMVGYSWHRGSLLCNTHGDTTVCRETLSSYDSFSFLSIEFKKNAFEISKKQANYNMIKQPNKKKEPKKKKKN